jgi:hypothetical protein
LNTVFIKVNVQQKISRLFGSREFFIRRERERERETETETERERQRQRETVSTVSGGKKCTLSL